MVRKVRLSREEFDGPHPSESGRDSFDDLDDLILDTVAADRPRQTAAEPAPKARRRRPVSDARRHLADADWLGDLTTPKHLPARPE